MLKFILIINGFLQYIPSNETMLFESQNIYINIKHNNYGDN